MSHLSAVMRRGLILIAGRTLLLALLLGMIGPFLTILVSSVGKGWFGTRWLPETWTFEFFTWAFALANVPKILGNSLIVAGLSVAISLAAGVPAGWSLARTGIPGREMLIGLILLPRMVPPITYALGVSQLFYRLQLVDTHIGIALAHSILTIPYTVLIMSATFQGLDPRLQEAADACGASAWLTFRKVIFPQVLPGVFSSILFAFITSYSEFTLAVMTSGPRTQTLPIKAYLVIGDGYWEVASAVSVILLVPSLLVLLTIQSQVRPDRLFGGFKGA